MEVQYGVADGDALGAVDGQLVGVPIAGERDQRLIGSEGLVLGANDELSAEDENIRGVEREVAHVPRKLENAAVDDEQVKGRRRDIEHDVLALRDSHRVALLRDVRLIVAPGREGRPEVDV